MRLSLIILFISLLTSIPAAQDDEKVCLQLGGGMSIKEGPRVFKEGWKEGFHVSGSIGSKIGPGFGARAKFHYHKFNLKDFTEDSISGGNISTYLLGLDGVLCPRYASRNLIPYAFAGLGASIMKSDTLYRGRIPIIPSLTEYDLYFNIGAGLDVRLNKNIKVFAEISYIYIDNEGEATRFIPLSAGIKSFIGKEKQVPDRWYDNPRQEDRRFDEPERDKGASKTKLNVICGAGGTFTEGSYGGDNRRGIFANFGIGIEFIPQLAFLARYEYHFLLGRNGEDISILGVDGRFLIPMKNSSVGPYITVGAGYPFVSYTNGYSCFNAGAGLEFSASTKNRLFIQGRYLRMAADRKPEEFVLLEAGIRIGPGQR